MTWIIDHHPLAIEELIALPEDMQAHYLRIAEMVKVKGLERVGMPYLRPIEGKLWEMRLKGRGGIARGLYVAQSGRRLMVLHYFIKKTETTPRAAILLALKRAKDLA